MTVSKDFHMPSDTEVSMPKERTADCTWVIDPRNCIHSKNLPLSSRAPSYRVSEALWNIETIKIVLVSSDLSCWGNPKKQLNWFSKCSIRRSIVVREDPSTSFKCSWIPSWCYLSIESIEIAGNCFQLPIPLSISWHAQQTRLNGYLQAQFQQNRSSLSPQCILKINRLNKYCGWSSPFSVRSSLMDSHV